MVSIHSSCSENNQQQDFSNSNPRPENLQSTSSAADHQSQISNNSDLAGIFSLMLNRQQQRQQQLSDSQNNFNLHNNNGSSRCQMTPRGQNHSRWAQNDLSSLSARSLWTKYCLLCTVCGSCATILAGFFLIISALFRYYTTSVHYFETVPTYVPAILLSICGVSTIAFSCKRNRNIILLRITAFWSLLSAAISSIITISTSLIHMNRLQTLKECIYNPPTCTCFTHSYLEASVHYVFENTPNCDVVHGILYSCLRAVFAISVVAVLLSIFLCMLLYQLIGHERKKAYWSRIRRINSDWDSDFMACLQRPLPRDRSSMYPILLSSNTPISSIHDLSSAQQPQIPAPISWGAPPPYESLSPPRRRTDGIFTSGFNSASGYPANSTQLSSQMSIFSFSSTITNPSQIIPHYQNQISHSNSNSSNSQLNGLYRNFIPNSASAPHFPPNPHPFSPTITLGQNQGQSHGHGGYGQFNYYNQNVQQSAPQVVQKQQMVQSASLGAMSSFIGKPIGQITNYKNNDWVATIRNTVQIEPEIEPEVDTQLEESDEILWKKSPKAIYSLPSTPIAIVRQFFRRRGSDLNISEGENENDLLLASSKGLSPSFQNLINLKSNNKNSGKSPRKKWAFGAKRNNTGHFDGASTNLYNFNFNVLAGGIEDHDNNDKLKLIGVNEINKNIIKSLPCSPSHKFSIKKAKEI